MPSVLIIYHFFYPDDVVSARQMSDLAAGLAMRGWNVTALTSNRIISKPHHTIAAKEEAWQGVRIYRMSRPAFQQSSNIGRLCNAFWLMTKWLWFIARTPAFDAIILGTDPQFGYFLFPLLKLLKHRTRLIHWVFDLYPECIVANEMGTFSRLAKHVRPITRFCYRFVDGMVDIAPCMRQRLDAYGHTARRITIVPWALIEPPAPLVPDPATRRTLFGDASLTLLYSGTIGHAHEFEGFIALARELRRRNAPVHFCFAGRGNRAVALRNMISNEDKNITFAEFADESQLTKRLGAGDIHMLSLRKGWEGIVLPSKFFGSLAAGRPLIYAGTMASAIPQWINQYEIGFVVTQDNIEQIADKLCELAAKPDALAQMQQRAFDCYHAYFSKSKNLDAWHNFLSSCIGTPQGK